MNVQILTRSVRIQHGESIRDNKETRSVYADIARGNTKRYNERRLKCVMHVRDANIGHSR